MFKKLILKKRVVIAALSVFFVYALTAGIVRPAVQSLLHPAAPTAAAKKQLPIYCVDTKGEKKVAVSFDAAWGADDTDTLLDILKKNDVKATFFLCGYWVDKYPDEVKKIYEAGHDIGNHSNTHPHSSQLSLEQNKENIMACHDKIKALLGYDAFLYRPPFGEYNDTVLNAAKECGYYPIQWDVDTSYTDAQRLIPMHIGMCSRLFR
ncbi:MAG: polysaccharide deacetylase family protein [Firmicutes bacterium]|nr:polysaccharide deacetylase family protein [Bacillota bacterium]